MTWGHVAVLVATSWVYILESRKALWFHGVTTTNFYLMKTNPTEIKGVLGHLMDTLDSPMN